MITFTVRIAGRTIAVRCLFETTREFCGRYLYDGDPDFSVEILPEDLAVEQANCARANRANGVPVRIYSDYTLEASALQRKITHRLLEYDTLLFHGSAVAVDGAAYLFTASSGTGKSTHTRLWRSLLGPRAVMVNDDKPFLRVEKDRVMVYGAPWSGKHRLDTNIAVPLKALCILGRGSENSITAIEPRDALPALLLQSCRPEDRALMPRYLDLIDGLARNTAFYRLLCNMTMEAAELAYRTMAE